MKITIITVFLLLIFISPIRSQWEQRYPYFPNDAIYDITFTSTDTGFFCNAGGNIFRTTDGGTSWERLFSRPRDVFTQIEFINGNTGFGFCPHSYVGDNLSLVMTNDGGESWNPVPSNLNSIVISIFPLTSDTSLSSSMDGEILKSSDGLINWQQKFLMPYFFDYDIWIPYGYISDFEKISKNKILALANSETAKYNWILTDSVTCLLLSNDGGENWDSLWVGSSYIFKTMDFVTENIGWMGGEGNRIMKTTDGGISWFLQYCDSGYYYRISDIFALDSLTVFAINDSCKFFYSIDGGATWNSIFVSESYGENNKVYFLNHNKGFISLEKGKLFFTQNGGQTWYNQSTDYYHNIFDIDFINENIGWAVGGFKDGYILKTNDGGFSWKIQLIDSASGTLRSIDMIDSLTGWATSREKVFYTINGGKNWNSFEIRPRSHIHGIYFYDDNFGIVFGVVDDVKHDWYNYVTYDGGINWNSYSLPSVFTSFNKVKFINPQYGFLATEPGLWISADSGKSWTLDSALTTYFPPQFDVIDLKTWWLVTAHDEIAYTSDAGNNWIVIDKPYSNQTNEINFLDNNIGFVAGYDGSIFFSDNGGKSWSDETFPTSQWLRSIDTFLTGNTAHIWMAGSGFTILHKTIQINDISDISDKYIGNFILAQNYPNPFNSETIIEYHLPQTGIVSLKVFDISGRIISNLVNEKQSTGKHRINFNASHLASGIYFYKLKTNKHESVKKMLLIR